MGDKIEDLTGRERECLYLATQFMRPKEIAAQLGISPRTVETHLNRSAIKLGVSNSRDAAKLYADRLAQYGSEKTPTETIRLSHSLTSQSLMAPQFDAEQLVGGEVRDVPSETLEPSQFRPFQGLLSQPKKGITPDDLSIPHMLMIIVAGAILLAVAIIVVIAMHEAFDKLATTLSSRS